MELRVRWATPADASLSFIATGVPHSVVQTRISARRVAVVEHAGQAIGALQLEYLWGTRPYIALIRVQDGCQRRGAGRALLAFVESTLQSEGHDALWSSSQANEPAPQAWHRHVGFVPCGHIDGINEGGIAEVFFRKDLGVEVRDSSIATAQPNERWS